MTEQELKNLLEKGVSRVIDTESLKKKLQSGKKLRIKFGIDPTAAIVHIGHSVPILKLAEFQRLGHEVILLIGDSTAQVGDTSDKDAERPMLQREETRKNAENYVAQFGKILDISKTEVRYNSEWMDTTNFNTVGELAKNFSVAEMLDRDNFSKRYKAWMRISLQEFLYPIMQGWDSVQLRADVELGWNDQYFNLLAGRTLQETCGQPKQDIIMFNLIEGTDGRKMSKTYKNFIGLNESANDMFVKVMEIKDELIMVYFEHCTRLTLDEVAAYKVRLESDEHPREIKKELALHVVSIYHGQDGAKQAQAYFEKVLTAGETPDEKDIPIVTLWENNSSIVTVLREAGLVHNSTEARNALSSGGVKIDGEIVSDTKYNINLVDGEKKLIQVGKKKFRYIQL